MKDTKETQSICEACEAENNPNLIFHDPEHTCFRGFPMAKDLAYQKEQSNPLDYQKENMSQNTPTYTRAQAIEAEQAASKSYVEIVKFAPIYDRYAYEQGYIQAYLSVLSIQDQESRKDEREKVFNEVMEVLDNLKSELPPFQTVHLERLAYLRYKIEQLKSK